MLEMMAVRREVTVEEESLSGSLVEDKKADGRNGGNIPPFSKEFKSRKGMCHVEGEKGETVN